MKKAKRNLLMSMVLALVLVVGVPVVSDYNGSVLKVEAAAKPTLNKTKKQN